MVFKKRMLGEGYTFDYGAKLGSPGDPPILLGALRIQVP